MIVAYLLIVGLCFGSFVNALIWRLHKQAELQRRQKPGQQLTKQSRVELQKLSISRGRSMCMHCGHELAPKDLVPVLSWLVLRGKCRYCGHPIPDTPLAELLVPLLFVGSYLVWPFTLHDTAGVVLFVIWLASLVLFVALALYDLRWYLLPNRLVLPLTVFAIGYVVTRAVALRDLEAIGVSVLGAAVLAGVFYALFAVSRGRWIGGGDVKLAVALGLLAGSPLQALLVLFFASTLGLVVSLPGIVRGKTAATSRIPFGPFLLLATCVSVLFGNTISDWYLTVLTSY